MEKNYKNHARLVIGFHGVLSFLLAAGLIGSGVNLTFMKPGLQTHSIPRV